MGKLTPGKAKRLGPGKHPDGGGLYLFVRKGGVSRQWIVRGTRYGQTREKGLGGFPDVTLGEAREKAREWRDEYRATGSVGPVKVPTFRVAAERYIVANAPTWQHPKTAKQTLASLKTYAYPRLGNIPIDRIRRGDVMAVLQAKVEPSKDRPDGGPLWTTRQGAAKKLRQRLRGVFVYALGMGWIDANPMDEALNKALPRTPKVKAHFRAIPHTDVRAALATVDGSTATPGVKLCMRFIVLTAVRSG